MNPTCLSFTFESRWLIKWLCSAHQSSDVICLLRKRKEKRQDHHCHQPVSLFDKRSTLMFNRLLLKEYCTILLLWLLQFRQVLGLQRFLNREMDWTSIDPSLPRTREALGCITYNWVRAPFISLKICCKVSEACNSIQHIILGRRSKHKPLPRHSSEYIPEFDEELIRTPKKDLFQLYLRQNY